MTNPVSTYRIQFHKGFSFQDFENLIPYFQKLGVGTIYASPILESVPGSTHGYDGVNPGKINPELGTLEDLKNISGNLKESGIGWLQDIVPNHMAFDPGNPWLMDVLEKGKLSEYAPAFDTALNSKLFKGKLMVPFLGQELADVIEADGIKLKYQDNRFMVSYEGAAYPLNPLSYITLLSFDHEGQSESVQQLLSQLRELTDEEDAKVFSGRWSEFLLQLASLAKNEQIRVYLDRALEHFNNDKAELQKILDEQAYELCFWQQTEEKINFRRFFTVNGLICLNMQDDQVFDQYHELVKELVADGTFQGLRIDHIDGLYDPTGYLEKLRKLVGEDTYIVAEKILEKSEELPTSWPIEGTTGYEFLAMVNNIFTNQAAEPAFDAFYKKLSGEEKPIHDQLISKKSEILYGHMGGELENLYQLFIELDLLDLEKAGNLQEGELKEAIGEMLIHCPVYRYYGATIPLAEEEAAAVQGIFEEIKKYHPKLQNGVGILEETLLAKAGERDEEYDIRVTEFYQRCMQFTGPLMAKGGEDTLMYTNNRYIGHNDVGDFPDRFGVTTKAFHQFMKSRQKDWPLALNATSTHDTKRGEDVRARLNVLTDLSEKWLQKVEAWQNQHADLTEKPTANDQYLIYQTLIGAHPMPGEDEDDFSERVSEYLQKALREAKTNTTWSEPDEAYEQSAKDFAANLLKKDQPFFQEFQGLLTEIADFGIINSLSQLILKFTCPGVPDVYQGCEFWDLSLVDPDNRRAVKFANRIDALQAFENYEPERLLEKLWDERSSGQIKLWLTQQLYHLRKENPILFSKGDYIPLKTRGEYKDHLLAFARRFKKSFYITVVPLHAAQMCEAQSKSFFELDWADTTVVLPDNISPEWESAATGETFECHSKLLPGDLFKQLPFAILKGSKPDNERSAGILVHITSLPSPFGIGDLGPESYAFADFLEKANQKYWQILPLNPTEAAQSNSPYSALSSRAGNPLLISPEVLAEEGLIPVEMLDNFKVEASAQTDFEKAGKIKSEILEKAFQNRPKNGAEQADFEAFCTANEEWLEDFALYMLLKKKHDGAPWYTWDGPFRLRDEAALAELREQDAEMLEFVKWEQYVFDKQWKKLRKYCNDLEIKLLGDIPFYVSYDSADVWANKELFCVDDEGKITGIAGVPPDAFSDDGQLWGMPVFNWQAVKAQGYQWWIDRLAKNIELFDLIRLDHFRAFADYWEVPGDEKTAINGKWKLGPDEEFFNKIKGVFGNLPFIAEDLGEIGPEVYKLRDKFSLPGMKVLQFAFDENMPQSDHIPHNYSANFIAYTGTHDNNTTRGWFKQSAAEGVQKQLERYIGKPVDEENAYIEMARLVYGSVAKTAILPIQDVLNLDESAKMNLPGSSENNWSWRLLPGQVTEEHQQFLADLAVLFNRD
ncbi:malto-oligosyltrehalose synthase [Dyadobacter luticola]|uniref:4-alpha-glucanotransferase n=1 Tax=Dyadobacter luticola TaxID=1979387 RepID=A0A5R9L2D1_9BACT|nr:malto-oligosyltrehalose synthase [Dyadobacter luticola]TLV02581.1 malto-oligosyltrehalose synthase [Dyadobacter luticola]